MTCHDESRNQLERAGTPGGATRRRFIEIVGATAGLTVAGHPILAHGATVPQGQSKQPSKPQTQLYSWRGVVLGASAGLSIAHQDQATARRILAACRAEISRLEKIFSLYLPGSAINRLNSAGSLDSPPGELLQLLSLSRQISRHSGGAFDPTVQPFWRLYARHFGASPVAQAPPSQAEISGALSRVGWRHVRLSPSQIAFQKLGMAITLNGIAQGYISDRVADLMRRMGIERALVNLGEISAIGAHPANRPWYVGIADPRAPQRSIDVVPLEDAALATSGGYGTPFDGAGNHHHVFDPRTGRSPRLHASVSVVANSAAIADGLSTAGLLLPRAQLKALLRWFAGSHAYIAGVDGRIDRVS